MHAKTTAPAPAPAPAPPTTTTTTTRNSKMDEMLCENLYCAWCISGTTNAKVIPPVYLTI